MNKKFSVEKSPSIFDLTALKLLLSVVAISLASMMSRASTMPIALFSPGVAVMDKAKSDLLSCPIPYTTEYCLKDRLNKSCEAHGVGLLETLKLTPFTKISTKPFCSTNETAINRNES